MNIVITGGTRGIGFALAKQFLDLGHFVVISGTSNESVKKSLLKLNSPKAFGHECTIEDFAEVEALYSYAAKVIGPIDIWINNAGINQPQKTFGELSHGEYKKVIDIDLIGLMNGTSVALGNMLKQGYGFIYNMEGLGSDGRISPKSIVYGTSKRAVRYFTMAAAEENKNSGVCIGRLSPGMVLTDFLLKNINDENPDSNRIKKIFNILADKPEVVTAFLSRKILKNNKNNSYIAWLTTTKIVFRFLTAFRRKNKFFATD